MPSGAVAQLGGLVDTGRSCGGELNIRAQIEGGYIELSINTGIYHSVKERQYLERLKNLVICLSVCSC